MNGRYVLTVQYSEPNPGYVPPPKGYYGDERLPGQTKHILTTVLSCELTPMQFAALKFETLRVWQMELFPPIQMDAK